MKMIKTTVLVALCLIGTGAVDAQEIKTQTITIKRGQSLDLFNGIRKPGTDEAVTEYFNQVFPPASKLGFKVDGSFITIDNPTKGNYHASFLSIMSWPNPEARNDFFKHAETMTYDFNEERKKIWSVFNFVEYEKLQKDIEFTVSSDKVYVISNYWISDKEEFFANKNRNAAAMKKAGGKLLITIDKGHSPNGYLYEPDLLSITEWESADAFKNYLHSNNLAGEEPGTSNVNQWITQFFFQQ